MGSESESAAPETVIICMPVFNDWGPAIELLRRIDAIAATSPLSWRVLYVDDGSTQPPPARLNAPLRSVADVEILQLRTNLGHQRAIAVGLSFIQQNRPCDSVVVMDADGEDNPEDIPRLVDAARRSDAPRIIFAKRQRRTEGPAFRFFYGLFKLVHLVATFRKVEVGNFSIIPFEHLNRLVAVPDIWNHYAASVFKARIPYGMIPIDRGRRIQGKSKMKFTSLVSHGLSAISVYAEEVAVRLLLATGLLGVAVVAGLLTLVGFGLSAGVAIPGWVLIAAACFWITLLQLFVISTIFVFVALHGRSNLQFLPVRDYNYFVLRVLTVAFDE
ncbi:MAG: glycosyltransferase [Desulfomonile tiedjei]|nr:glycosyltransferase [Desulfomonile tiedjei]